MDTSPTEQEWNDSQGTTRYGIRYHWRHPRHVDVAAWSWEDDIFKTEEEALKVIKHLKEEYSDEITKIKLYRMYPVEIY